MIHTTIYLPAPLTVWIPDNSPEMNNDRTRPTVIICPGGGYEFTSDREAEPIALSLVAAGCNAAVLRYSCKPAVFPQALNELAESVSYIRSRADWHVCSNLIFVMGFSAGAHLAASLGSFWNKPIINTPGPEVRPDGMILCYPVISSGPFAHQGSFTALLGEQVLNQNLRDTVSLENQVSKDTPPAFIWHTFEDELVPVENSLDYARELRRHDVPVELHVYRRGKHGLSSATANTVNTKGWGIETTCQNWLDMAITWINDFNRDS